MSDSKKWQGTPSVAVDAVIFTVDDGLLKVLLIKRSNEPFKNQWALPGGFLWKSETLDKGVKRVLSEKAGLERVYTEQLYAFDSLSRDPRGHVISVTYYALTNEPKINLKKTKAQTPEFFAVNKLPDLAFDHARIIKYALKRLRNKLEYTNVVHTLLPNEFSLGDLLLAYEAVLGEKLDKRNFRKKFLSLGLIKPTKNKLTGIRYRPAELFTFKDQKLVELKRFF